MALTFFLVVLRTTKIEGLPSTSSTSPLQENTTISAEATAFSTATGKSANIRGVITGSVIGGVGLLVVLALLLFLIQRRRREDGKAPSRVFHREMVKKDLDMSPKSGGTRSPKKMITSEGGGWKRSELELDPVSSTTPLREDMFEEHNNDTSSADFFTSAGTQKRPLESALSRTSTVESGGASRIPIPPLIPVSSNHHDPPSPAPVPLQTLSRARMNRQVRIEQKIIELQERFITARGSNEEKARRRAELKERIDKVKKLRESSWAYGAEGEVPTDLVD